MYVNGKIINIFLRRKNVQSELNKFFKIRKIKISKLLSIQIIVFFVMTEKLIIDF